MHKAGTSAGDSVDWDLAYNEGKFNKLDCQAVIGVSHQEFMSSAADAEGMACKHAVCKVLSD